jgi:hypothetical protein
MEQLADALLDASRATSARAGEGDVLEHGHVAEERVVLETKPTLRSRGERSVASSS